jgi:hypothetical protein
MDYDDASRDSDYVDDGDDDDDTGRFDMFDEADYAEPLPNGSRHQELVCSSPCYVRALLDTHEMPCIFDHRRHTLDPYLPNKIDPAHLERWL